jgi:N,N'-diacetyllegionaminate synthase
VENGFKVGTRDIGEARTPFIIAEAGINHNGDLKKALEMIELAKSAGADAVKFQTFKASEFCGDSTQMFSYISNGLEFTEPMLSLFERVELGEKEWEKIKEFADKVGITFFSTPQNYSDLEILLPLGIEVIKIGSDDLTNLSLIEAYSNTDLPIILSSGMSNIAEVYEALEVAGWFRGKQVAVLVCTSQYPTPIADVNIRRVSTLRNAFPGLVVGFSDHTLGNNAAVMALTLGARIFEKHFTLSHDLPGPDHWFSLNPSELHSWVDTIREASHMLGSGQVMPTQSELSMRELARRSVVALRDIDSSEELSADNIGLRRPGTGLSPKLFPELIGRRVNQDIKKGSALSWADVL